MAYAACRHLRAGDVATSRGRAGHMSNMRDFRELLSRGKCGGSCAGRLIALTLARPSLGLPFSCFGSTT